LMIRIEKDCLKEAHKRHGQALAIAANLALVRRTTAMMVQLGTLDWVGTLDTNRDSTRLDSWVRARVILTVMVEI